LAVDNIIEVEGLTKRFGGLTAVNRLSLSVAKGEIFGLVGPDGAGKTTILRLLAGLMTADEGQVRIGGYDVARQPGEVRDRIGYMAQRFGLYSDLTVEENLAFYSDLFGIGRHERDRLVPRLLQMTRMSPFLARQAGRLSGGMKQKLALMCTLLHKPGVLLLDEPTCGVDPVSRRDFWEILYALVQEGMTVLLTTAYLDEAERCDRVGLVHRGALIRCDTPAALKTRTEEECYKLACPDQRAAKALLENLPEVASVEPFGGNLHLFLSPGRFGVAQISRALDSAGLGPADLAPVAPSLEDVFILMIRKASREAA